MVFSWFKLVFMLYVFGAGCYLASSLDLQQAFGVEFISYGVSLIFLAMLSLGTIIPFRYAVNRHNRAILAFVFVMETIVFAEYINIGLTIRNYTIPLFPKSLQLDCLRNSPLSHSVEECTPFYASDRTAGFRLFWAHYFSTRSNKKNNQVLVTIQSGQCCGFFAPFSCLEDKKSFPKNRNPDGVNSALVKQRVTCSIHDDYYPQQRDCVNYIDFAAGLVGGCFYDLGAGYCLEDPLSPSSLGCASSTEDYCISLILAHALLIMGCSTFNIFYMFLACVMWWKRKESDVFPEFIQKHEKETIDYKEVRYQFEIVPRPGILRTEGFVPPEIDLDAQVIELTSKNKPQSEESKDIEKGSDDDEGDSDEDD